MSEWSKDWVRLEEIPKKCFSSNQWNSRFAWHWGVRFNVIHSGPLKTINFYLKGHIFRYKLSFCGCKVFICVGLNFLENVSCFVLFMALVIHSSFLLSELLWLTSPALVFQLADFYMSSWLWLPSLPLHLPSSSFVHHARDNFCWFDHYWFPSLLQPSQMLIHHLSLLRTQDLSHLPYSELLYFLI